MKKILAFGASNSKQSINKKLAAYTAQSMEEAAVTVIDLNDFEMPIYGIDLEKREGVPALAKELIDLIGEHDGIIVSLAEHNHNFTAAFKNILDWATRVKKQIWQDKPVFLLSTSPGQRGGAHVMKIGLELFPFLGANITGIFSLPLFRQNFSEQEGILDDQLAQAFQEQLQQFEASVESEITI